MTRLRLIVRAFTAPRDRVQAALQVVDPPHLVAGVVRLRDLTAGELGLTTEREGS